MEFDAALNTAVRKLREALNDSADNPRFLETIPRRGYRFVAPVVGSPEPQAVTPIQSATSVDMRIFGSQLRSDRSRHQPWRILGHFRRSSSRITPEDTIVLADFANSTGDAVFDDTLKTALSVSLRQSPFLNVLSDSEVARTLQADDPSGRHETHARGSPRALPAGGQQSLHCRSRLAVWAANMCWG